MYVHYRVHDPYICRKNNSSIIVPNQKKSVIVTFSGSMYDECRFHLNFYFYSTVLVVPVDNNSLNISNRLYSTRNINIL